MSKKKIKAFDGISFIDFVDYFDSEDKCLLYLAELKWDNGFVCKKCGHTTYIERERHSRMCTRCKHIESPTSGTFFHKLKFGLRKAFMIIFELATTSKGISALQISKKYELNYRTAWRFVHRVLTAMGQGDKLLRGIVEVDDFVVGSKEKGRQGRSRQSKKKKVAMGVEFSNKGGIKKVEFEVIPDYTGESISSFFHNHISADARVRTDKFSSYQVVSQDYAEVQEPSLGGRNFSKLHIIIFQVKSWLRIIFSGVSSKYIQKYLDEFAFSINHSINKEFVFHNLIVQMVKTRIT